MTYWKYYHKIVEVSMIKLNVKKCKEEWGNKDCYASSYKSDARGLAILCVNNFDCQIIKEIWAINGNMLIVEKDIIITS